MIKKLILSTTLAIAISTLVLAQDAQPQKLGAVPGATQYSLVKTTQ